MTFSHPGPWLGFDFLGNAGIGFLARAQLPVAMGNLWHLMFEGSVVSLESPLDGGSSQQCSTGLSRLWLAGKCTKAGNSQQWVGTDWKMHLLLFAVPFLLGSVKPGKGKSPGEDRSVFVSPLEPLGWF